VSLLELTDKGLYCEEGDFFIDPWRPVARAVVTHAHADHARPGMKHYLCASEGAPVLRARLGESPSVQSVDYGQTVQMGSASVTLHPAGHILGSAQILIEGHGERVVVTGDYKVERDPTATAFELVTCDTLITESTFGLPVYRWPAQDDTFRLINAWWRRNAQEGRTSVLFAYALGKAQRVLAGIQPDIGPILTHGAVERMNDCYREAGIVLPATTHATDATIPGEQRKQSLVIAPPSANGTTWLQRFAPYSTAFASGWMAVRGRRRQRSVDRGFVLSDHVDWHGLLKVVEESGASRVLPTHGFSDSVARYLREKGLESEPLRTEYQDEVD
jgi:putative mRNA 3-end processing factor